VTIGRRGSTVGSAKSATSIRAGAYPGLVQIIADKQKLCYASFMKRSDMRRKAYCALVAKAAASFCLQRAKRKANLAFGPFSAPKRLKRWGRRQDLWIVAPSSRAAEGRPRGCPSPDRLWRRFSRRRPGNYNLASHAGQRTEKARFGRNQSKSGKGPNLRSGASGLRTAKGFQTRRSMGGRYPAHPCAAMPAKSRSPASRLERNRLRAVAASVSSARESCQARWAA